MPKRRSKRAIKSLSESTLIDTFFSSLERTQNKITTEEKNNLKKIIESTVKDFNINLCRAKKNACTQDFLEELVRNTKISEDQWVSTLEYWLKRIFYLYKTVDSFSEEKVGYNYLVDKNLDLQETFTNIKQAIEKSTNKQTIINVYKQNLFNLREGIINSFTKDNYLLSLLKEITFSENSKLPISSILEINKKINDKIIKYDKDMYNNIKMGMQDPLNVVNGSANPSYSPSSVSPNWALLPSEPEIKTAGLLEGISPQNWTFGGVGFSVGCLVTGLGLSKLYCFFNKRNQQPAATSRDVEANSEFRSLTSSKHEPRV